MVLKSLLLWGAFAVLSSCTTINNARQPKFFGGVTTSTIRKSYYITSIVPSSCVQVEPTLPFCRNVRNIGGFPKVVGRTIQDESNYTTPQQYERQIQSTQLGWGEYFGIAARTVTLVEPVVTTLTKTDPNVVVTFSVKGCKPTSLPYDMDRCEPPSSIYIEQILPTTTAGVVTPTPSYHVPQESYNGPFVEAAEGVEDTHPHAQETEALQHV